MGLKNGYVWIPGGKRGQGEYEHRLVWVQANGPVPPGHTVHHRNGVRTDNRLENLELVVRSEHGRMHGGAARPRNGRWAVKYDACVDCGTSERKYQGRGLCSRCYQRAYYRHGHKWPEDLRFGWTR